MRSWADRFDFEGGSKRSSSILLLTSHGQRERAYKQEDCREKSNGKEAKLVEDNSSKGRDSTLPV